MVTKVPELLRTERAWGAVPDHPQIIGYLSILLNATGLRKGPGIGYTWARQTAWSCWMRGWLGQSSDCGPAVGFKYFIGIRRSGVQVCQALDRPLAMQGALIMQTMRRFVAKRGRARRAASGFRLRTDGRA
jgi:hypothetical protein